MSNELEAIQLAINTKDEIVKAITKPKHIKSIDNVSYGMLKVGAKALSPFLVIFVNIIHSHQIIVESLRRVVQEKYSPV